MKKRLWTREELILALNLYLKLPFGKMHSRTKEVVHLAELIDRTPSSIAMRLSNFAAVDPYHQNRGVSGLSGGKKQVQPLWDEFINNREDLLFESERILAEKEQNSIEKKYDSVLEGTEELKGQDKLREVKTRVNQSVFRQMVLANYSGKCAVTGIDVKELLIASHIVPWSADASQRLNPENGLCLSALYDKAYDKGLIALNTKFEIILSKELKRKKNESYYKVYFEQLDGQKLALPSKYYPRLEFVEYHLSAIFRG